MAINNILPKKAQFYGRREFPDYDFFSNDALNDAKKLADVYYKNGFKNVATSFVDTIIPPKINILGIGHLIFKNSFPNKFASNGKGESDLPVLTPPISSE